MNPSKEIFANVHSIETFGTFDGPGVRFVLFLQGCPFQCKYCHNRDTWSTELNKRMTVDDVLNQYDLYKHFYKKGGLTVSGGEPLMQIHFLIELFKRAKEKQIHTCLDTSGGTYHIKNDALLQELITYTDLVLLDIKHIDEQKHVELTKNANQHVLAFAKLLDLSKVKVVIRHVLVPTITDHIDDLHKLRKFLDTLSNVVQIDILPYHKAGINKWNALGYTYELSHINEPTKDEINIVEHILKDGYQYAKHLI